MTPTETNLFHTLLNAEAYLAEGRVHRAHLVIQQAIAEYNASQVAEGTYNYYATVEMSAVNRSLWADARKAWLGDTPLPILESHDPAASCGVIKDGVFTPSGPGSAA